MLYLIQSNNYYKIGYTDNWEKRKKQYDCCNPCYTVIDLIDGDRNDETKLHNLLSIYKYKLEWYESDEEVLNLWNKFKHIKNA